MKEEIECRNLFTVEEIRHPDGFILYSVNGTEEDGTTFSIGNFNEIDLLIEVLKQIGKIGKNTKVFINNNE